jgi:hypothetical protein
MFRKAPRTCCLGHIYILRIINPEHDGPSDGLPHSTRRAPVRRAEKPCDRRNHGTCVNAHMNSAGGCGKHGDESDAMSGARRPACL